MFMLNTTPALYREVRPVISRRLELTAFFAGLSAVAFWAATMW